MHSWVRVRVTLTLTLTHDQLTHLGLGLGLGLAGARSTHPRTQFVRLAYVTQKVNSESEIWLLSPNRIEMPILSLQNHRTAYIQNQERRQFHDFMHLCRPSLVGNHGTAYILAKHLLGNFGSRPNDLVSQSSAVCRNNILTPDP